MNYKNYKFKPGELFTKHQEKMKKKHEKHEKHKKVNAGNYMANEGATPFGRNQAALRNFGRASLAPNANSTKPMFKKHEKHRKHEKHEKHKKNWIAGAIKHPGALHSELGVKQGHKIPAKTLAKAAKKGGVEGKRARLAETLKSFHHKKHKMVGKDGKEFKKHEKHMKHEKHEKSTMHCKMCGHVHE